MEPITPPDGRGITLQCSPPPIESRVVVVSKA
jgi:hypothetical protein